MRMSKSWWAPEAAASVAYALHEHDPMYCRRTKKRLLPFPPPSLPPPAALGRGLARARGPSLAHEGYISIFCGAVDPFRGVVHYLTTP